MEKRVEINIVLRNGKEVGVTVLEDEFKLFVEKINEGTGEYGKWVSFEDDNKWIMRDEIIAAYVVEEIIISKPRGKVTWA